MHVHVGEPRDHRAALAVDAPAALGHGYLGRGADGDDPPVVDDDGALFNGHAAVAVDDSHMGDCDRIRARPGRCQPQQRGANTPADARDRETPNPRLLAVHDYFPRPQR